MRFTGSVTGKAFSGNGSIGIKPFVAEDAPRGTSMYDSLGDYRKSNASASGGFNDQIEVYFTTAGGLQDFSTSGAMLLKSTATAAGGSTYLIDDDSGSDPSGWVRSTLYNTLLSNLTTNANTSDYVAVFSGLNDANASGGLTKTEYKNALQKLKEFIQADFENVQWIQINPVHRSAGGSPSDTQFQIVREAQLETIAEDSFFKRGVEVYDQAHRDAAHPTDAAFQGDIAKREAKVIAKIARKSVTGVYGPIVTAADFQTDSVILTVAHDAGTDLTVTGGSEDTFGVSVDGTVYQPSAVSRVSATSLKLDFDGGDFDATNIEQLNVVYGAMEGLTQATPETVKDNATDAMPLQSRVLTPTVSDPLIGTPTTLDLSAKLGAKTMSGAGVTEITDRIGSNNWDLAVSSYEATYDATAFGGSGGLIAPDNTTSYRNDANITALAWNRFYYVIEVPETVPADCHILGFGSSTGAQPTPRCSLLLHTDGEIIWQRTQGEGEASLVADARGQRIVMCFDSPSVSEANVYVNDASPVTFDPRDNIPGQTRVWLFGGDDAGTDIVDITCPGLKVARFHWVTAASEPTGLPSISSVMTYLQSHYTATGWTSAVPTLPDINADYPGWVSAVESRQTQFEEKCPAVRPNMRYISTSGNDSNDGLTPATAWLTKTKVNTEMAPNTAFLFKRGDEWLDQIQITVDEDNVTIGDYGSGDKPLFNAFTGQIASGTPWTLVSGDIYKITVPSGINIMAVRDRADPLYEALGAYWARAKNASGHNFNDTVMRAPWYYHDTSANELYLNLDSENPGDYDIEYLDGNQLSGVEVENVDGARVSGIRTDGFSLSDVTGNHNNAYGVMTKHSGDNVGYVTGCECYFGSSHLMGHLQSFAGGGGNVMFADNKFGFAAHGGSGGETLLNFYTGSDGGQIYDINSTCEYGTIPSYLWDFEDEVMRGRSLFAHSVGSNNWDLCVSYNHTVKSSFAPARELGGFNDVVDTGGDIALCKSYIVGAHQEKHTQIGDAGLFMGNDTIYWGNYYGIAVDNPSGAALWTSAPVDQWWINCVFEIDFGDRTSINFGMWNSVSGNANPKFWHCSAAWINFGDGVSRNNRVAYNYDNRFDNNAPGSGLSSGAEFVNSVDARLTTDIDDPQTPTQYLGLDNLATKIRNSAFFSHDAATNTSNNRGYGNAANTVELTDFYVFNQYETDLEGVGEAGLVAHDYYGRARDTANPDIGAIEFGPALVEADATKDNGISLHFEFDETTGDIASDSGPAGANSSIINGDGAANWVDGVVGTGALSLNGSNEYIETVPFFSETTNKLTMTAWVKLNDLDAFDGVIVHRDATTMGLLIGQSADKVGYLWNADAQTFGFLGGPDLNTDVWTFIAVVIEPDKATLYAQELGGTLNSGINYNDHAELTITDGRFNIGLDPASGTTRYLDGLIDDVRVYNRALSPFEIQALANLGA